MLAFALLLMAAPVIALLAAVVYASSSGPALIRLPRVGQGGRSFGMWKLRTMYHAPRASGAPLTSAGDARITRTGRVLRRLHLDELPQLANVVLGDMALIGPRPETPELVDQADARWRDVLAARPGIVGPTQMVVRRREGEVVATAGEDGYRNLILPAKLAIDAWYVSQASPRLDALVVRSLLQELRIGRGLHALERRVGGEVAEAGGLLSR